MVGNREMGTESERYRTNGEREETQTGMRLKRKTWRAVILVNHLYVSQEYKSFSAIYLHSVHFIPGSHLLRFPRRLFGRVPSGSCSAAQNRMWDVGQVRSEMDVVLIEINYIPNETLDSPRVLAGVSWTVNDWKKSTFSLQGTLYITIAP